MMEDPGSPRLRENLTRWLSVAQSAVNADKEGDYNFAVDHYRQCASSLRSCESSIGDPFILERLREQVRSFLTLINCK